jgi:hypothetical protein
MSKKKDLLDIAKEMRNNLDKLPQNAMIQPLVHYDLSSLLTLLVAWFEADLAECCKEES